MSLGLVALITVFAAFILMYLREMRSDGVGVRRIFGYAIAWLVIILVGYGLVVTLTEPRP